MGVGIAMGVMAGVGALSSFMGSQAEAAQAEASYLANKIEVERQNFQNSLANDKKNMAAARANAMRRYNNQKITEAATTGYADQMRDIRVNYQSMSKQLAEQQIAFNARLTSEATGRNLRGGMVERMKSVASDKAQQERLNNRRQRYSSELQADANYKTMLNKRDMMSRQDASIYLPGSTGVKPGDNTMGMLVGMLGGAASGAAQGLTMGTQMSNMGWFDGASTGGGLEAPSADSYMEAMFGAGGNTY